MVLIKINSPKTRNLDHHYYYTKQIFRWCWIECNLKHLKISLVVPVCNTAYMRNWMGKNSKDICIVSGCVKNVIFIQSESFISICIHQRFEIYSIICVMNCIQAYTTKFDTQKIVNEKSCAPCSRRYLHACNREHQQLSVNDLCAKKNTEQNITKKVLAYREKHYQSQE